MVREDSGAGWRAHPTAEVSQRAAVGAGTVIWRDAHIREDATVGQHCVIGAGVYVGAGVTIGDRCKIQNDALLYEGLTLEAGVFVGPQVCFTNDYWPRAINPDGTLKAPVDWEQGRIRVRYGASIGARAVVVTDLTIGAFALVGAGSVVTRDVPAHALVFGAPARLRGWVCACGRRLQTAPGASGGWCAVCGASVEVPVDVAAAPAAPARRAPVVALPVGHGAPGLEDGDGRWGFPAWTRRRAAGMRVELER